MHFSAVTRFSLGPFVPEAQDCPLPFTKEQICMDFFELKSDLLYNMDHSYHIKLRNFSLASIFSLVKCYMKLIRYLMLNFGNSVEALRNFRAVPKSRISWTLVALFFTITDGSNAF